MQVSFRSVLLSAVVAASFAAPAFAEIKVGVVDYARLLEASPQAKTVQESLRSEFGPRYQQLVAQETALKAKAEKLQKDAETMAPEQRAKAEKDLRDSARELERKKQEWQDDSNAKRNEEMAKLQRVLDTEVRDYAKAQALDLVIVQGVMYATANVDITPAVLKALEARAPRPAAAPATGAPPAKPPAKP